MELRQYQRECVDTVWKKLFTKNNILVVAPTASGKTEIFIDLCRKCIEKKPDIKILILTNKVLLVEQSVKRIGLQIENVSTYCGSLGTKEVSNLTVATIQSIYSANLDKVNLIIADEIHRVSEDEKSLYQKLLTKLKHDKLKLVGFSATPYRATGYIYGKGKMFSEVDWSISMLDLIRMGHLAPPHIKHMEEQFDTRSLGVRAGEWKQEDVERLTADEGKMRRQLEDAIPRLVGRFKVVWACSSIDHAEKLNLALLERGEKSVAVHSKKENSEDMDKFENKDTKHLVFVSIIGEGYSFSPIDAVVLMRPIRSPVTYVQTVGRGLRTYPEKVDCLVLDYGNVVEHCGPLNNPYVGSKGKSTKKVKQIMMKFCKNCLEYVPLSASVCPACDTPFAVEKRTIQNLSEKAASGKMLEDRKLEIQKIKFHRHTSKSGNECLKIEYITNSVFERSVYEYFVIHNNWGRMAMRLTQLGIKMSDDIYVMQIDCKLKNLMLAIYKENGYTKVRDVLRK